jgi:parallel beta-helix repeat protein
VQSVLNIITNNNFTLSHSYLSIGGNNNTVNENLFHTSIGVGPNAHNNTVSQNMIFSTGSSGIAISYGSSSHNEVFGNEISISGNWGGGVTRSSGVSISYCRENVIYNNTIRNADIGLYLCTTTNNLLYRNKMENVSENVVTEDTLTGELGFNSWDNGREGNYWSGYTGADADGDGVGDAPYVINENNIDHYPLMPYYEPDVTSPVVSFSSPEDKTYNDGNIELTFAANEPVSWVGYSLDGQDNVTIAGNTTLTDLRNGSHNVTVYATDLAGNTGASETLVFTVDLSEPFPTVPVAAAATSIIVVLAGFLVYFKKRKN